MPRPQTNIRKTRFLNACKVGNYDWVATILGEVANDRQELSDELCEDGFLYCLEYKQFRTSALFIRHIDHIRMTLDEYLENAIKLGELDVVQFLLSHGARARSAFRLVCQMQSMEMLNMLLRYCLYADEAIVCSCEHMNLVFLRKILFYQQIQIEHKDIVLNYCMALAISARNRSIVRCLLPFMSSRNQAIHFALSRGYHDMLPILVSGGFAVRLTWGDGDDGDGDGDDDDDDGDE